MAITTDAWVLEAGPEGKPVAAELVRKSFTFQEPSEEEALVEPLYGSWEGNMSHALSRSPVDICRQRGEPELILGNAGVVRVLEVGKKVRTVKPGQLAIVFCNGVCDEYGYPKKIYAYDAPNTVGLLAKKTKLHQMQLIAISDQTRHSMPQWAAFSLRYITAWSNWELAYGVLRLQISEKELPRPHVWGWGGGVTMAELALAKHAGCEAAMISSIDRRLKLIERIGIRAVDRRKFGSLSYDEKQLKADPVYKEKYLAAEKVFLDLVAQYTEGRGVNIFIDYVGAPVQRPTLKALAREGIITTAGWKEGMVLSNVRAIECIERHQHVHTHYAKYSQGVAAVAFAEAKDWMPIVDDTIYKFDEIPQLAKDYEDEKLTCFPVFQING